MSAHNMKVLGCILATTLLTSNAAAQLTPGAIPPAVEPTRPQQGLEQAPTPQAQPRARVPLVREQTPVEDAERTSFVFRSLQLEGVESLPLNDLIALWPYKAGETVTVQDLFVFANSVTRYYSNKGYLLAFAIVPEQDIVDGALRVQVVEGFVSDIQIKGPDGAELGDNSFMRSQVATIRDFASKILKSRPLKAVELERYLLLINDLPGVDATAEMSPSPDVVGGSTLTIGVKSRPVEAQASYSNNLSQSLGRDLVGGGLAFNAGRLQVRMRGYASPDSQSYRYVSGEVTRWIGSDGWRLTGGASKSWTRPRGPILEAIDYRGESLNADIGLTIPIQRSRSENWTLALGGHLINSDATVLGYDFTQDHIRQVTADLTWDKADASRAVTMVQIGAVAGLPVLGATKDGSILKTRATGQADFVTLNGYAQRYQPLTNFGGGELGLFVSGSGQVAVNHALLSVSECAFGGTRFGRGFDNGALTADHCVMGSAELRYRHGLGPWFGRAIGAELFSFVDGGRGWQKGPLLPGELRRRSAASAGGGARFQIGPNVLASVDAAHAIHRADPSDNKWRVNLSLSLSL
ncbi:ShlB/FhaC/HecB family hemolysin secretion/activation protein [Sphingobium sp. B12D2B]|uniref:ShlB/FhaC/HecB family hemolysin secretion/activation protein n=1 Tax=Sphingobium sp. B12D2B TaxID=2940577 RepID=UPI002224BA00|nr:POTRA domain-containing protein [Sphingobium sp. B12D2B]MCW2351808.1 hemolysin activation/secretion protein [Sphingobium sp. B12D2B]